MPKYRLHYFPESGNSYKLALMLTLCGQTFEPVWTDFGGGVTRTPEWRRDVNVMGEIPVLEVDGERRPRERALNAVTNHYQCKDGRWLILSLLNEDRQWPTLARCLGREDLVADPRFETRKDRHARSVELIKIFDETFATRDLAEWRTILDGNGVVFGVVGILDDIPNDRQMIDNEVLVPFENDTMLTISSPIWVDGSKKVQPRKPPGLGEHSDEILRNAGYDEAAIGKLRAAGAVA